jgi:hypothetical protein
VASMNGQAGPSRRLREPNLLGLARAKFLQTKDYQWAPTHTAGRPEACSRASQFVTDKVPTTCSDLYQNRTLVVTLLPLCGSALAIAQRGAKQGGVRCADS